jgi:glycosyltransferase involved in cell wall biosynthesis
MNIFFDARWTRTDRHDGISRFGSSLLGALAQLTPVTMLIHDERQLALLPAGVPHILVNHPLAPREVFLPRRLNEMGADVVYSPMQIMGTHGRRYKLIFTLHDTIYYRFPFAPTYLPAPQRAAWWLFHQAHWPGRLVLNLADVVATVSETSKREILERHLTDRPVVVIHNAAPDIGAAREQSGLTPDLVFMGTLMPYKGAETLVRAMPLLPGYRLHLTGRGTPDRLHALEALAGSLGVADRVRLWNGASDEEYVELLATATASVSASKAEGFGLPMLEAMSSGVPFIGTDMPVFREVGGDAALYFDPDSPEQFATRVRSVEDPATRARLVASGHARAAEFNWERSAATLYEVMRGLTGLRPGKDSPADPHIADAPTPTERDSPRP